MFTFLRLSSPVCADRVGREWDQEDFELNGHIETNETERFHRKETKESTNLMR